MIDFRYHLVSIVAVFLALAIGIVLGSTALQGSTLDVLRSTSDSLQHQLNAASAERDNFEQASNADDAFLQTAGPKLLDGMLTGTKVVVVTEPGAPSAVVNGIEKAAGQAGATLTGSIALQPKFNDLTGATKSSLSAINAQFGPSYGIAFAPVADDNTVYEQNAAQVLAAAILGKTADDPGLPAPGGQTILRAYAQGGYLTYSGNPAARATLAVVVTPPATATDGSKNWADETLLAVAAQFASASAATLVAGPVMPASLAASPVSVLRNSSVSSKVSSVDNADTRLGQISAVWALADQLRGGKPNSYGVSGASAVSPVPAPAPSATPTLSATPQSKVTGSKGTASKGTGKVKKTVKSK